jgi:hypothetical protein
MPGRTLQWALLSGSYLALTGSPSVAEYLSAAVIGLTGVLLVPLVRARSSRRVPVRAPWPSVTASMLRALLRDSFKVGYVLLRSLLFGHRGRITHEPTGVRRYPGDTRADRRAVALLQESIAPNTFVLDTDGEDLSVHRLS